MASKRRFRFIGHRVMQKTGYLPAARLYEVVQSEGAGRCLAFRATVSPASCYADCARCIAVQSNKRRVRVWASVVARR